MSEQQQKIWTSGLIYKKPSPKAPDFIKANLSFKVDDFIKWLKEHDNNGWVNVDVKESKNGKIYCELSTYYQKRMQQKEEKEVGNLEYPENDYNPEEIATEEIPF